MAKLPGLSKDTLPKGGKKAKALAEPVGLIKGRKVLGFSMRAASRHLLSARERPALENPDKEEAAAGLALSMGKAFRRVWQLSVSNTEPVGREDLGCLPKRS